MAFLTGAAERPHHAYVFAGPEGSGKSIAARAFVAALLCADGGCGICRACRLALEDHHPNVFLVEPEGRDIHVDTIREEVWTPAYRTAPEPGRKVFMIREADRLSPAAADTLLKVLEEPPADSVLLLMSARAHELPDTVLSRCHVVTFTALSESFVVEVLAGEGVDETRARLAARLAGGNLGRARRLATAADGLRFREAARARGRARGRGHHRRPRGGRRRAGGGRRVQEGTQGRARRRRSRRSWMRRGVPRMPIAARSSGSRPGSIGASDGRSATTSTGSCWRCRRCSAIGSPSPSVEGPSLFMNPDLVPDDRLSVVRAARGLAGIEQARADLAEDLNLNPRLLLERAFLRLAELAA